MSHERNRITRRTLIGGLGGLPLTGAATPFERHQDRNRKGGTHTVRVLAALREIVDTLEEPS